MIELELVLVTRLVWLIICDFRASLFLLEETSTKVLLTFQIWSIEFLSDKTHLQMDLQLHLEKTAGFLVYENGTRFYYLRHLL